jgi:hypothetical protein
MITQLSRVADCRRSYSAAVGPPTRTSSPPAWLTVSRRPGTSSNASVEYGSTVSWTSTFVPGGPSAGLPTAATVSSCLSAAVTGATSAASGITTVVGTFAPAGKCCARISWPRTDSTSPRNELPLVSPVSRVSMPAVSTSSTATVPSATRRGRAATRSPTRRQKPCVSSVSRCRSASGRSILG